MPAFPWTARSESQLLGDFRFEQVDGLPVPLEFPPGSGAYLEDGSLTLDDTGRFSLRFFARAPQEVEATWAGQDGSFTVKGDSLFFTPDDAEDRPPVRFRFEAAAEEIQLWDTQGYRWSYSRRPEDGERGGT